MDFQTFLIGVAIFLCRCCDVSLGTMRTIAVVNGRILTSFLLGFVEISIWLAIISIVLVKVEETPILGLFYAFGFSSGNVLGIYLERILPIGNLTLRIFIKEKDLYIVDKLREKGLRVTVVEGSGKDGKVFLLFIFLPKKKLKKVWKIIKDIRKEVFYTLDYGGQAQKTKKPRLPSFSTSWYGNKKKFK